MFLKEASAIKDDNVKGDMDIVLGTLSYMSGLDKINEWGFSRFKKFLGKRVLEAGCGNGNLTSFLLDKEFVLAIDNDDGMINAFKERFGKNEKIRISKESLNNLSYDEISKYAIDSIMCVNTLEHIEDDVSVLKIFYSILNDKGNLVLLVPAHKYLFTPLDEAAGHYRRYSMSELRVKVEESGFKVKECFYFNFFAIFGWFLNGKILKKRILSNKLLGIFDFLIPAFDLFEKLTGPPIGISIILVCEKD